MENINKNEDTTKAEATVEEVKAAINPDLPFGTDGRVVDRPIIQEMKSNFIDYSMSVIVSRALPDVRDGLKPSQRRTLVAMNDLALTPGSRYRKSAKIIGQVTGDYHPHGDQSAYGTMVKMAQDFSMRYTIVNGQGNFGSIDGDPPAQMRYTEARMDKIAGEIIRELNNGTVLFTKNYDGTKLEPLVLPTAFPNLICNGADGIAVGMATKIPPHNLSEIVDALTAMIDKGNKWAGTAIYNNLRKEREKSEKVPQTLDSNPQDYLESYIHSNSEDKQEEIDKIRKTLGLNEFAIKEEEPESDGPVTLYPQFNSDITVDDLMQHVPGPDFPLGGSIYNRDEIKNAYATGRGRILMRAKASIQESTHGKFEIIVTEIPYQVNKANMIAKIADLVKDKKLEGISDLRDESNREGIRVVIELKKSAQPKTVLNKLYKYTEMQKAFNANMIALVNNEPEILNLKELLEYFLTHRIEVTIRKFEFDIAQKKYRAHILEGLRIALDNLDEIIKTIRESATQEEAKENLINRFALTDVQAQAILDMQLRRLAALERKKIEEEYAQIKKEVEDLEMLLADPQRITKVVRNELIELKEKFGDARRTKVFKGGVEDIEEEDLIAEEETFVTVSHGGYVKRMSPETYKVQKRGGKGIMGAKTKEDDYIEKAVTCSTHDEILFFTNKGRVFQIKAFEVPEYGRTAKGIPAVNLIQIDQDELITAVLTRSKNGFNGHIEEAEILEDGSIKPKKASIADYKYLFMATKNGIVKKTKIEDFDNIRSNGLISINLDEGDELKWVQPSGGEDQIILVTKYGRSIRFHENDVRDTGRNTRGVMGIRFKKDDDQLISMDIVRNEQHYLLTVSEFGYGKMTKLNKYPLQGRAGQGVFTFRVTNKTGNLVVAITIESIEHELVLISRHGLVIRSELKQIAQLGRHTSGVKVMRLNKDDTVAATALMAL